jgi:hypothetical protein
VDDVAVERFQDDEAGYERWLADHPDLFVLNTARIPAPNYLVLHRATCHMPAAPPHPVASACDSPATGS